MVHLADAATREMGLQAGDALIAVDGQEITKENSMAVAQKRQAHPAHGTYQLQGKQDAAPVRICS